MVLRSGSLTANAPTIDERPSEMTDSIAPNGTQDPPECSSERPVECPPRDFERVPDRGRRVLTARFVDDLSYKQIGERVGISLEGVRKALFRLKRQVRSCVEARLGGAQ